MKRYKLPKPDMILNILLLTGASMSILMAICFKDLVALAPAMGWYYMAFAQICKKPNYNLTINFKEDK